MKKIIFAVVLMVLSASITFAETEFTISPGETILLSKIVKLKSIEILGTTLSFNVKLGLPSSPIVNYCFIESTGILRVELKVYSYKNSKEKKIPFDKIAIPVDGKIFFLYPETTNVRIHVGCSKKGLYIKTY